MASGQRDPDLERRWRERVAQWQASGLSVREFCHQQELIETSFQYWKRELRVRDRSAATGVSQRPSSQSTTSQRSASQKPSAKQLRPTFVPMKVFPSVTFTVEVRCPSGHMVILPACDAASLASLFAALNPPAGTGKEPSC